LHLGRGDELEAFLELRRREREIAELMVASRERLAVFYARSAPAPELRAGKAAEFARLRELLAAQGMAPAGELNNARLAAVATYHRCVPALAALLAQHDGDLPAFYATVRTLTRDSAARSKICPPL
jgi:predicted aminopeptidase